MSVVEITQGSRLTFPGRPARGEGPSGGRLPFDSRRNTGGTVRFLLFLFQGGWPDGVGLTRITTQCLTGARPAARKQERPTQWVGRSRIRLVVRAQAWSESASGRAT